MCLCSEVHETTELHNQVFFLKPYMTSTKDSTSFMHNYYHLHTLEVTTGLLRTYMQELKPFNY